MTPLSRAVQMLDMSVSAARLVMLESKAPLQRRLSWFGSELERLAAEAYRLADEAGDDPDERPICLCQQTPCVHYVAPNAGPTRPET